MLAIQQRIAQFLNEKISKIDLLIQAKRELLMLISEKRRTLITRVVTKGLGSCTSLKDSGIDWLDGLPDHWNVLRLKYIISEPLAYGISATAEFDDPNWPRFVRISDVDEQGKLRDETFRSLPPEVADRSLLQSNDVLIARSGATVGKSFIYKESWGVACYAGYLVRARVERSHDARYVYWFLNSISYWEWIQSTFIQSTIQNISADRYSNLKIPIPPPDEQSHIADFIERSCIELDATTDSIVESIELLNEYRAALTTAAVTGSIEGLR